jgi:hypothetical protein
MSNEGSRGFVALRQSCKKGGYGYGRSCHVIGDADVVAVVVAMGTTII